MSLLAWICARMSLSAKEEEKEKRRGEKLVPVSMRKGKGKVCDFDFDRLRIRLFRPTQRTKGVAQGASGTGGKGQGTLVGLALNSI